MPRVAPSYSHYLEGGKIRRPTTTYNTNKPFFSIYTYGESRFPLSSLFIPRHWDKQEANSSLTKYANRSTQQRSDNGGAKNTKKTKEKREREEALVAPLTGKWRFQNRLQPLPLCDEVRLKVRERERERV